MFTKSGFNRSRQSTGNPTSVVSTTGSTPAVPISSGFSKELPAVPNSNPDPTPTEANPPPLGSYRSRIQKRYSVVSAISSLHSGDDASESSFCVSPISENSPTPQYLRKGSEDNQASRVRPISPQAQPEPEDASLPQLSTWLEHKSDPSSSIPQDAPPKPVPPKEEDKSLPSTSSPDEPHETRWDSFSGGPTIRAYGRPGQANPHNAKFHKPSGSAASNILQWGREQLQPKKKFAQARSRISSFSKNDPTDSKETQGRSSPPYESSRAEQPAITPNGRESPFDSNEYLGFVPTTVTTITPGGRGRERSTERPYSRLRRDRSSEPKRELNLGTPADTVRREKPSVRFGSTTILPEIETRASSLADSPRDKSNQDPPATAPEVFKSSQSTPDPRDPQSRIRIMEAKRRELKKRRMSLETLVNELTRAIQPGPGALSYDMAAKAEVKKSLQSMESEIAEIKREEHEIGFKLSRAWKRWDEQENNGDGSNLWIKRVTS
ncbi:hypothetical protein N7470_002129 [Penicillium chermesinum]|nr:hypothetical protein N7470_002129 [Penicillium chermesinum]